MISSPEWELPKMPFEYTTAQADVIMRAMELNYRMEDVLSIVYEEDWFKQMTDEEQYEAVRLIAIQSEKYISDYDDYWRTAIDVASNDYIRGEIYNSKGESL